MCNEAPGTRQLLSLCSRLFSLSPTATLLFLSSYSRHSLSLSLSPSLSLSLFLSSFVLLLFFHPHVRQASRYPLDILRTFAPPFQVPNKISISDISLPPCPFRCTRTISSKRCSVIRHGFRESTDFCSFLPPLGKRGGAEGINMAREVIKGNCISVRAAKKSVRNARSKLISSDTRGPSAYFHSLSTSRFKAP